MRMQHDSNGEFERARSIRRRRHARRACRDEQPLEEKQRSWVLTFPFAWRCRLAHDGALLRVLTRIFVETVYDFYAKHTGEHGECAVLAQRAGRANLCTQASDFTRYGIAWT